MGTLHNPTPLRVDIKTTSRPSGVQVPPAMSALSVVSCLAWPPADEITNSSLALNDSGREKATHLPSGENSGRKSWGELVNSVIRPACRENKKIPPASSPAGEARLGLPASARVWPSADQETPRLFDSATFRSTPPFTGMT